MNSEDFLHRFLFENMAIRGEYIHLKESYQTILNQHQYPASLRKLLGEALCVAGLLTAIIKFEGRLTVQFRGKGKLKLLLAQCDSQLRLRGLAKWEGEMSYDDLMQAFSEGILVIMVDSTSHKNRYQGMVAWQGNSLVDSIEAYFRDSEQLATKLWLSVDEEHAVGLLLQVIPTKTKEPIHFEGSDKLPHWDHVMRLTEKLSAYKLLTLRYSELLNQLYPDEAVRVFKPVTIAFGCTCSRKRSEDAIYLLGREEAEEEIQTKNIIVVTCDFCNKEYLFDRVDVAAIFDARDKPSTTQLH